MPKLPVRDVAASGRDGGGRLLFFLVFAIGFLAGLPVSFEAAHIFVIRNAPIVTGQILARRPTSGRYPLRQADFTIRINGTETVVHAHTGRYLLQRVMTDTVKFRYSGDPGREVFLFEHEENPYWILALCWGTAAFFTICLLYERFRRSTAPGSLIPS